MRRYRRTQSSWPGGRPRTEVNAPVSEDLFRGFRLGDLRVEPLKGQVSDRNGSRHMSPKVVELLLQLAGRPREILSRDCLLDAVWGAGQGSQEALGHAISALRYALADHPANPRFIQTLPRRGYRLLVEPLPLQQAVATGDTKRDSDSPASGDLFAELKRRGVVQTGIAYAVLGWLVLQVADATYDQLLLPQWFGTATAILVIAGFPIALLLAWFMEIAAGRVRLDRGRNTPTPARLFPRPYAAILGALVLASMGIYAYDRYVGLPDSDAVMATTDATIDIEAPIEPNSIAVLPFRNIDGSEETRIFSEGLAEDVINRLARVPSLRVSARGDSFSLPRNASSEDVRKRLRVSFYLEGSVRLTERLLRVVIHLNDSENGFRVLSRSFSRDRAEFFAIQDEITNLTVANLRVVLPPETQSRLNAMRENTSLDAYMLYRRGIDVLHQPMSASSIGVALDWFRRSLELDPDFAAAHAGICRTYGRAFVETSDPAYIEQAENACAVAIDRNPNLDVVHIALGTLYWHTGRDRDAEAAFGNALKIDGNGVQALRGLADVYTRAGRLAEAEAMHQRAVGLQPGDWLTYDGLGRFLFQNGRYGEAADQFRKILSMDPENMRGHSNLGAALMLSGNFADAASAFLRSIEIQPRRDTYSNLGLMYYYQGNTADAVAAHRKAIELSPQDHLVWANLGDALAFTDDADEARLAFSKAEELAEVSLSVNPVNAGTLIDLAWIKAMLGKPDEAHKFIARAAEITQGDPYVHFVRALVSVRLGDMSDVYDDLQAAIEAGYSPKLLAAEPHLKALWNDPRFMALTSEKLADNSAGR